MNIVKWIAFSIIFLMIIGCGGDSTTKKASSFDLNFYTEKSGPKPQAGEYAYFQMDILDDQKKLLQSYRNQKRMPSIKIPELGSEVLRQNPIPDALRQMSLNDSVGIIIPKDSIPDLASGYDDLIHLEYVLVLKDILSEVEYQKRLADDRASEMALMTETKARLPEIKELANETIRKVNSGELEPTYLENGLGYIIHEKGDGEMAAKDRMVSALYYGATMSDSKRFDDSFSKGRPYSFRIGRRAVIEGWDEGFMLFPVGTKASLFIPSELGYGERGSEPGIPPNADLYFYVEFVEMFY